LKTSSNCFVERRFDFESILNCYTLPAFCSAS
jgi:hypothetical protein